MNRSESSTNDFLEIDAFPLQLYLNASRLSKYEEKLQEGL